MTGEIESPAQLSYAEAGEVIEYLSTLDLSAFGSLPWLERHENFVKLNIQAHLNIANNRDEYIAELVCKSEKSHLFLNELLLSECWSKRVFPEIVKSADERNSESYNQSKELEFSISIFSLSILRYLTDHLDILPINSISRLIDTHDIIQSLVCLLKHAPWIKKDNLIPDKIKVFEDGQWSWVGIPDYEKVSKAEAQVWLTLLNIIRPLMERKSLLDQIPVLEHLQRALDEIAIMNVNVIPSNQAFMIKEISETESFIDHYWTNNCKTLLKQQIQVFSVYNHEKHVEISNK
ncbi:hypothetical protein ROZALSC1DRAFT_27038 [Rozella allomycis CSF55]|uniref:Uncharacterized protein n=1 Tax=Rozella allomycis (strain CSF55) TaxID=988480 RepID=A0A075B3S3_ROZAC|nr:hypothetical protein O9G_004363 [Rozella allomycis CSF55]RKP21582.1 hypothetical protein ROZALSC1DRAFT_27038 [Rozella allomycis CSF55]|eukprot:EPZ35706.1 hypothetical protein O9G_004363 [Rozella allomycis CSF55]